MRSRLIASAALTLCLAAPANVRAAGTAYQPVAEHDAAAFDTGPVQPASWKLIVILAVVGASLAGLLYLLPARAVVAAKRRLEADLTERASTLQEEDRRRIARELHDGAGQALTAARLQLAALAAAASDKAAIAAVIGFLDEAMEEIRRSTTALSPPALAEYGLRRAVERYCTSFSAASKLKVTCDLPASLPDLPADVEIASYRIIQEAVCNAVRHSGACAVCVQIAVSAEELRVEVSDDGAGLNSNRDSGFGLDSIRQRAKLLEGAVELGDRPGTGTWLRVRLPLEKRRA